VELEPKGHHGHGKVSALKVLLRSRLFLSTMRWARVMGAHLVERSKQAQQQLSLELPSWVGGTVLCHHSHRQISLTSDKIITFECDLFLFLYMLAPPSMNHNKSSLPSSSPLWFTLYFQLIFASIQAKPPVSHIISSFSTVSSIHICTSKGPGLTCSSYHFRDRCRMWWKARQWRF